MTLSAITLFCDDIRREYNGQRTLVGLYRGAWLAESLPFQVKKLYMVTLLRAPTNSWPERITLTTTYPGTDPESFTLHSGDIEDADDQSTNDSDSITEPLRTIEVSHVLEDVKVTQPGAIAVTVEADGLALPAGHLKLDVAETPDTAKTA